MNCSEAMQFLYSRIRYLTANSNGASAASTVGFSMPVFRKEARIHITQPKGAAHMNQSSQRHCTQPTTKHHGDLATRPGQTGTDHPPTHTNTSSTGEPLTVRGLTPPHFARQITTRSRSSGGCTLLEITQRRQAACHLPSPKNRPHFSKHT